MYALAVMYGTTCRSIRDNGAEAVLLLWSEQAGKREKLRGQKPHTSPGKGSSYKTSGFMHPED
jgi:hypothetical protein